MLVGKMSQTALSGGCGVRATRRIQRQRRLRRDSRDSRGRAGATNLARITIVARTEPGVRRRFGESRRTFEGVDGGRRETTALWFESLTATRPTTTSSRKSLTSLLVARRAMENSTARMYKLFMRS